MVLKEKYIIKKQLTEITYIVSVLVYADGNWIYIFKIFLML